MIEDLINLLQVESSEVSGVLDEFIPDRCDMPKGVDITFHYIRFQNDLPRTDHFISVLCNHIIAFCLRREKISGVNHAKYRPLLIEARDKFSHPIGGKTGEPGELITFFLLEGYLRVPKIFSKMSLKTNSQMHVHGADGVHLGIDGEKIILYFGESKLYSSHTNAISEALESVKTFVTSSSISSMDTQQEFEIRIISDNLDIPVGRLRDLVIKTLNPYSAERDNMKYVYACFIGFDVSRLSSRCDLEEFKNLYQQKAELCYKNIREKIFKDTTLGSLSWRFFFLPFASVDEFRNRFLEEIKK